MAHDRLELQNRNDDKFQASNSQQPQPRMDTNLYERGGGKTPGAQWGEKEHAADEAEDWGIGRAAPQGARRAGSVPDGPAGRRHLRQDIGGTGGAARQGNIQGQAGRQATSSLVKPFNLKKLFP